MLDYQTPFWRFTIFKYISAGIILFVVLTSTAMFIYPGGPYMITIQRDIHSLVITSVTWESFIPGRIIPIMFPLSYFLQL